MKKAIIMMAVSVLGLTAQAQTTNKNSKTIVLVHGAWSDASPWDAVTPLLKAKGEEVINVNLAGHGKDSTSFAGITFKTYVDQVKAAIGTRTNDALNDKSEELTMARTPRDIVASNILKDLQYAETN